ncbi:RDD family protein [Massilia sp. ZL223]|uniref:RDD family protein n=1 Tax=Massilia sp. ZL223 TaxID=2824904 RepID=UPI001B80E872|nr:RDD family protein [Massilia sp. ZL223]MBQ5964009.1 RDD family protein [Massilia sp. ZL223]
MQATETVPVSTPPIKRRVLAMVYEGFLLLAVEMLAVLLYLLLTGNRQEAVYQHGLKAFLFLVTAAYFIWCWVDSGHTLAMKTWRIKVVQLGHARLPWRTAVIRFLLAWGWFVPALLVCGAFGLHGKGQIAIALAIGVVAWALTAFLDKDRQFLHDKLAGTRLIALPKRARA